MLSRCFRGLTSIPTSRCFLRHFTSLPPQRFPSLPNFRHASRPVHKPNEEEELSPIVQAALARQQTDSSSSSYKSRPSSGVFEDVRLRAAGRFFFWLLIVGPMGLVLALHIPLELMWINGESMSPLFNTNHSPDYPTDPDWIIVQRFFSSDDYLWWRPRTVKFERGQIVTFYTPHNPRKVAVKRIVGLPGDLVMPLPGYAGGDVLQVVPFGHLWVEGDADTREKSMDSNWYGPISQSLVIGEAVAIRTTSPWYEPWHWYKWIKFAKLPYGARARVMEGAVQTAMNNPDDEIVEDAFENGNAEALLKKLLNSPDQLLQGVITRPKKLLAFHKLYQRAQREVEEGTNPDKVECAKQIVREAEKVFEAAGLGHYEDVGPEAENLSHGVPPVN